MLSSPAFGAKTPDGNSKVQFFTSSKIKEPLAIASGPDGALWFTNVKKNTIGRITTAGVVTDYTS
ncbi:MAG: hypothetical protein WAM97_17710, partial [Acidimicrobiales bacterium]